MKKTFFLTPAAVALAASFITLSAGAAVSPEEAAKLKGPQLTPMGAERAGNADGSIPAWTGGLSGPANLVNGGRRPDPFSADKPLFSITGKNVAQYADRLAESQVAMLKKYPDYRLDVYPTRRPMAAPQWVYDNIFKNATRATLVDDGYKLSGAYGGIPFPIPKNGREAMWNHRLGWRTPAWSQDWDVWLVVGGKPILASGGHADYAMPYYFKDRESDFKGTFWTFRTTTAAPAIRAGEAVVMRENVDERIGSQIWTYVVGQRRVRKLPVAAYDSPTPTSAGLLNTDETNLFAANMDRYEWKLVGKKELYIPTNNNKFLQPSKASDVLGANFLNPDHIRWELHRVWVIEADLKPGMRHIKPKRRFYLDEDSWICALADSWDARGQMVNAGIHLSYVVPEGPGVLKGAFGMYDLITGDYVINSVLNNYPVQLPLGDPKPDAFFSPEALSGEGVR